MSRIDALDKVLGRKIFVRDLRAEDVRHTFVAEDWGVETLHALTIQAYVLDRPVIGLNRALLKDYGAIKAMVHRAGLGLEDLLNPREQYKADLGYVLFNTGDKVDLLVPLGQPATYVGQPVAILLFDNVDNALNFQRERLGLANSVCYGPPDPDSGPSAFHTRTLVGEVLDDWLRTGEVPPKHLRYGDPESVPGPEGQALTDQSTDPNHTLAFRTETQSVDPGFLEPDSALGRVLVSSDPWSLALFAPTQSPGIDQDAISRVFTRYLAKENIEIHPLSLGGGFGGRDFSTFPIYGAMAAIAGQGRPVRLTLDRYTQFAIGIKRHASAMCTKIGVNSGGKLVAIESSLVLDGGSQKDVSTSVQGLALHSSIGAYRFDQWKLSAFALKNHGPLSGSVRGFGIPQVMFNVEQAIDQIAITREEDPIAFRCRNVVQKGDMDIHRQTLYHDIRNREILTAAASHSLWRNRKTRNMDHDPNLLHGVGFAMAMEAFGTSKDGASACLSLEDDLALTLHTEVIEMGQGATTGLAAIVSEGFGNPADHVVSGAWDILKSPIENRPESEIFVYAGTTSASKSMFFHGHVIHQLMDIWKELVWLPQAAIVWSVDWATLNPSDCHFDRNRTLHHPEHPEIEWSTLARAVLATGQSRIYGHGSFKAVWSWARFEPGFAAPFGAWLDALSVTSNTTWPTEGGLMDVTQRVLPTDPRYGDDPAPGNTQRSVYASGAWIIRVTVNPETGAVKITDAVCILDAGDRASDSLVKGQVEGSLAQGIGFALKETLPDGPVGGQRSRNFDSYAIPRLGDMPVNNIETVFVELPPGDNILCPIGENDPAPPPRARKKGIAEIALTPVAPAIANAIFDSFRELPGGKEVTNRLTTLPMTPDAILRRIKRASP